MHVPSVRFFPSLHLCLGVRRRLRDRCQRRRGRRRPRRRSGRQAGGRRACAAVWRRRAAAVCHHDRGWPLFDCGARDRPSDDSRGRRRIQGRGGQRRRFGGAKGCRHDRPRHQRPLGVDRRVCVTGRDPADAGHVERDDHQRRRARGQADPHGGGRAAHGARAHAGQHRRSRDDHRSVPARRRIELHAGVDRWRSGELVRRRLRLLTGANGEHRADRGRARTAERALRRQCDWRSSADRVPPRRTAGREAERRRRSLRHIARDDVDHGTAPWVRMGRVLRWARQRRIQRRAHGERRRGCQRRLRAARWRGLWRMA